MGTDPKKDGWEKRPFIGRPFSYLKENKYKAVHNR
jgi:hypothetical protein